MNLQINSLLQDAINNFKRNNFPEAKILLFKILDIEPYNFDALNIIGVITVKENNHIEAINFFKKAQKIRPDNNLINFNLGKALSEIGNDLEAIKYYKIAIRLDKNHLGSWLNFANSLYQLERYDEALTHYDQAIKLKPDYAEAYHNKGNIFRKFKRYDEALSYYDQAIRLKPDYVDAFKNMGNTLHQLKRYEEALNNYNEAIRLKPDDYSAYNNIGITLNQLKRYEEALNNYNKAIRLKPDYPDAYNKMGITLHDLARYDEALNNYNEAIRLKPDYAEAYLNKSYVELILGNFVKGWDLYQYRWRVNDDNNYFYSHIKLLDSISDLKNKKVIVWQEQGFGDVINFSRYIYKLKDLGALVTFVVNKDLAPFFIDQFDCDIKSETNLPDHFDFQIPMLDLPRLFNTTVDNIPFNNVYLRVNDKQKKSWKKKLSLSNNKLNIGLSISGNINHTKNHVRSIPLEKVSPLFSESQFFLIQKELNDEDKKFLDNNKEIIFLGNEIKNFSDTAAIIENMDLILTVDTSIIHLAGALGKKSFLMLSFSPDWRWLLKRNDTPWYKSVRVFRQETVDNWKTVIDKIKIEIDYLILNTK